MGTGQSPEAADALNRMLDRYQERIQYYSKASRDNKRAYKTARYLTVVLGALVTLLSSLSSAYFIRGTWLETGFDILTPSWRPVWPSWAASPRTFSGAPRGPTW